METGLKVSLTYKQLLFAMLGVGAVALLSAIDATVVGTVVPRAAKDLEGMALYAWVGIAYLLSSAAAIPIFGRLGDLFGRKRFIQYSLVIVFFSSLACVLAPSFEVLILARFVQGIGGGMMVATAFAVPADIFSDRLKRVRWQAIISVSYAVGSGLGPLLGGMITETLGWRWAFLLVPSVAIMVFILISVYLPKFTPTLAKKPYVDWVGSILLALTVTTPILAIEWLLNSNVSYKLGLGALAVTVLACTLLIKYEQQKSFPILPLRIFSTSAARQIFLYSLTIGAVLFAMVFYAPLLLQNVFHFSPKKTGLMLTPLVAMIPLGSIVNGRLYSRLKDPKHLLTIGAFSLSLSCLAVYSLTAESSIAFMLMVFSLTGLSLGLILPNLTLFIQFVADRRDMGSASAMVQTMRTFGGAVGAAGIGMAVAHTDVQTGIHIGLLVASVLVFLLGIAALRLRLIASS